MFGQGSRRGGKAIGKRLLMPRPWGGLCPSFLYRQIRQAKEQTNRKHRRRADDVEIFRAMGGLSQLQTAVQKSFFLDLSSAFVLFAEATFGYPGNNPMDKIKVMTALRSRIAKYADVKSGNMS